MHQHVLNLPIIPHAALQRRQGFGMELLSDTQEVLDR
jgi:hypothetical protein